jgi:hypothetical protein
MSIDIESNCYIILLFLDDMLFRTINEKFRQVRNSFQQLNLFASIPPSTDEQELRNQKWSTLLFIFFICLSLTILLLYTSLITVTKTFTVRTPSLAVYQKVYMTHAETLTLSRRFGFSRNMSSIYRFSCMFVLDKYIHGYFRCMGSIQ